ncbi:hypothetical protein [Tunicatimonas pelagia]|uniref:hypothetical protein n=1 Tax=Tunicatimonas pelagia TaxID=931531 RepID=UPI0026657196|nr:hypothetical protein [Tunicatimonas pelagia]WKN41930.1 hypothetical protein P0M28_23085 [Tunicatimonas pelagia]
MLLSVEVVGQEIAPHRDTLVPSIDTSLFSSPATPIENRLNYSRNILNQSFDFKLESISDGKFEINISGSPRTDLKIRVYDVIGNLLYEDAVRIRGFLRKELDLSDYKSNFFIIEIGNESVNKTKSIVAL